MKRSELLAYARFPTSKVVLNTYYKKPLYANCLCKIYFQRIDYQQVPNLYALLGTIIFVSYFICLFC